MSSPRSIRPDTTARGTLAARCQHHPSRPAAARCPSCGGFFCRECVTEHDGRMLCASCLARSPTTVKRPRVRPFRALAALAGFAALWGSLYLLGRLLLAIPSETHPIASPDAWFFSHPPIAEDPP